MKKRIMKFMSYVLLFVDAIQLEEGNIANPYNLVENGAFLSGESGWSRSSTLTASDMVGGSGTYKYFRFTGTPRVSKGINQYIDINGKEAGACCLLIIKSGKIETLEIFIYIGKLPSDIKEYKIFSAKKNMIDLRKNQLFKHGII